MMYIFLNTPTARMESGQYVGVGCIHLAFLSNAKELKITHTHSQIVVQMGSNRAFTAIVGACYVSQYEQHLRCVLGLNMTRLTAVSVTVEVSRVVFRLDQKQRYHVSWFPSGQGPAIKTWNAICFRCMKHVESAGSYL